MLIIISIIRFAFSSEDVPCRGRLGVFFHEGGGVVSDDSKGEAWLSFFEWFTTIVVTIIIVGVVIYACCS